MAEGHECGYVYVRVYVHAEMVLEAEAGRVEGHNSSHYYYSRYPSIAHSSKPQV